MSNWLKKISNAFSGPQGLIGPPRFPTDTSQGRQYSRLRYQALTITREQASIPTPPSDNPVWAVLMETGHPKATETLALVSDGTSSVYVSNGDGVIGGQGYENVIKANADFFKLVNRDWQHFQPTESSPIPDVGYTVFYARTDDGLLFGGGAQKSLIRGHVLSDLFQAGHEAITQLHIIAAEKKLTRSKSDNSEDYYDNGVAYAAKGNFYYAIVAYNKAIELNPSYVDAYINRGVAYGSLGNFDHAFAEFNKAIDLNPNDAYAYYNRARSYKDKNDSASAIVDYSKAIELNSNYAEAYLNRGLLYESLEHTSDAVKDFERFLEISTDSKVRKLVEEELRKIS
jgi:tetratricopeptide (TPR) repeat protein